MELTENYVDISTASSQSQLPITVEAELGIPVDDSMRMTFIGHFNGFGVEVSSTEEMSLLYHMGCFGKGSISRSKPSFLRNDPQNIIRERQYKKRLQIFNKFEHAQDSEIDLSFIREVEKLSKKISKPCDRPDSEVIDLVSSDDDVMEVSPEEMNEQASKQTVTLDDFNKGCYAIVVPDSDSDSENYFKDFKPKCCLNLVKPQEKLILSLNEAYFLAYGLGCMQIINYDKKPLSLAASWNLFIDIDPRFVANYVVYHYFRSKGYIVKSGLKFGGDYLIYKEGPGISHSDYIVIIWDKQNQLEKNWLPMLGHIRMAGTTSKQILLAEVHTSLIGSPTGPEDLSKYTVQETILMRNALRDYNQDEDND